MLVKALEPGTFTLCSASQGLPTPQARTRGRPVTARPLRLPASGGFPLTFLALRPPSGSPVPAASLPKAPGCARP